ncbi:MAG: DUF4595 domain-containing protein [Bacteroidota bacterium]
MSFKINKLVPFSVLLILAGLSACKNGDNAAPASQNCRILHQVDSSDANDGSEKHTYNYTYDSAGRVKAIQVLYHNNADNLNYDWLNEYSYAPGRVYLKIGSRLDSAVLDAEGRVSAYGVSTLGSSAFSFSYDAEGHLISKTESRSSSVTTYNITWDNGNNTRVIMKRQNQFATDYDTITNTFTSHVRNRTYFYNMMNVYSNYPAVMFGTPAKNLLMESVIRSGGVVSGRTVYSYTFANGNEIPTQVKITRTGGPSDTTVIGTYTNTVYNCN